jgi:hypothetical protein
MDQVKDSIDAMAGHKTSEISVPPSKKKKPYKITTEADAVAELKGQKESDEDDSLKVDINTSNFACDPESVPVEGKINTDLSND